VEAILKKSLLSLAFGLGLFGFASNSYADVQYVSLCDQVIPDQVGFYFLPGFEFPPVPPPDPLPAAAFICVNPATDEVRQSIAITSTSAVIWRSFMPYPEGKWVSDPQQACGQGRLVEVGTFKSTNFSLNAYLKLQTPAVTLQLNSAEFITKVIMSGGFDDPRVPGRAGTNGSGLFDGGPGLCLRSIDPAVLETQPSGPPLNPPYGDGGLPIGCIADGRIVNMPLAYAISSTAAYPSIDSYLIGNTAAGPYLYGKRLVVSTDVGPGGPAELTYCDPTLGTCGGGVYDPSTQTFSPLGKGQKPLAGTLSVWACVAGGAASDVGNGRGNVRGTGQ